MANNQGDGKSKKQLRKELEDYRVIMQNLRPFIVLALDEFYVGDNKDELKSKLKDKGIDI